METKELEKEFLTMIEAQKRTIYKVCYIYANDQDDLNDLFQEKVWMIGAVCLALIAFYILELGFNTKAGYEYSTRLLLPLGLSLLTFGLGLVFAKWQLRRHAQQLGEIERGLEELREFEK